RKSIPTSAGLSSCLTGSAQDSNRRPKPSRTVASRTSAFRRLEPRPVACRRSLPRSIVGCLIGLTHRSGRKIMRRTIVAVLVFLPALMCGAVQGQEGRWEGQIRIPGRNLPVVVDLAPAGDAWNGSIILPGLGIKGAPLSNVIATPTDVAFDIANLLETPPHGPARFKAHLDASEGMEGEMMQGGNVAKFSLKRIGAAQVDTALRSTPVKRTLEDRWIGEFELGGYPRHVTMTLANNADAAATATLVVVGKQTANLPVDLVIEEGRFLRIESRANRVAFEGRFIEESDEIRGTFELGPYELPLVLRRSPRRAS